MTQDPEQRDALLADYVDGNLAGDALREAETYLAADPALRATLARMMADSESLRALPRVNAPADLSEDLRGHLERDQLLGDAVPAFRSSRRPSGPVAAMAAMLLIGLGLGGATYWLLANRPTPFLDVALRPADADATREALPESDDAADALAKRSATAETDDRRATDPAVASRVAREDASRSSTDAAAGGFAGTTDARSPASERIGARRDRSADETDLAARLGTAGVGTTDTGSAGAGSTATEPTASRTLAPTAAATASPAPELTLAASVTGDLLDVSTEPVPADVVERLAGERVDVMRRSIVLVVDAVDTASAASTVRSYFDASTATPAVNAQATDEAMPAGDATALADRAADGASPARASSVTVGGQDAVTSNTYPAPPVAQAIAGDVAGAVDAPSIVAGRGLTEQQVATLQARLRTLPATPTVSAYEAPFDAAAFNRALMQAARGELVISDPQRGAGPTTAVSVHADAATRPAVFPTTTPARAPATIPASRPATTTTAAATLRVGERLRVTLVDPDASNLRTTHDVTVARDGQITLPSLDALPAVDRSADALRAAIARAYQEPGLIRRPIVRVESLDSGVASRFVAPEPRPEAQREPQFQQLSQARVALPPADDEALVDVFVVVRPATPAATTRPSTRATTRPSF